MTVGSEWWGIMVERREIEKSVGYGKNVILE